MPARLRVGAGGQRDRRAFQGAGRGADDLRRGHAAGDNEVGGRGVTDAGSEGGRYRDGVESRRCGREAQRRAGSVRDGERLAVVGNGPVVGSRRRAGVIRRGAGHCDRLLDGADNRIVSDDDAWPNRPHIHHLRCEAAVGEGVGHGGGDGIAARLRRRKTERLAGGDNVGRQGEGRVARLGDAPVEAVGRRLGGTAHIGRELRHRNIDGGTERTTEGDGRGQPGAGHGIREGRGVAAGAGGRGCEYIAGRGAGRQGDGEDRLAGRIGNDGRRAEVGCPLGELGIAGAGEEVEVEAGVGGADQAAGDRGGARLRVVAAGGESRAGLGTGQGAAGQVDLRDQEDEAVVVAAIAADGVAGRRAAVDLHARGLVEGDGVGVPGRDAADDVVGRPPSMTTPAKLGSADAPESRCR